MYVGGGPNQQLIPAVGWAVGLLGKRRFFLVGSDYVYSHACHAIIRDRLGVLHAEVAGEEYVPLPEVRGAVFDRIAAKVKASGAQAILSTVDGQQANLTFFHALTEAGVTPRDVPCISFSFSEVDLRHLDERDAVGHYAAANYFQSLDTPANKEFLRRFYARHPTRSVSDSMVAAYSGVYLWKQAVEEAGGDRPPAIRAAMRHQKFAAPEGWIQIDPKTQHAIRKARVGVAVSNRAFKVEFESPEPMDPEPFPPTRTRAQWEAFLQKLYRGWGDHWEAPAR
jgi:urea transport system substrate-binding protein